VGEHHVDTVRRELGHRVHRHADGVRLGIGMRVAVGTRHGVATEGDQHAHADVLSVGVRIGRIVRTRRRDSPYGLVVRAAA
jgi:hypothetical protein